MTKLFKKNREKALKVNNTVNYFKYAIGEILLVVIGILIALQINNWNEERKNDRFENEILLQIQSNLNIDKQKLLANQMFFNEAIKSSNKVLESDWNANDRDSLSNWLADIVFFGRFQPLTNAYEVLKSKGLDLISNHSLRFLLGAYYDDEIQLATKAMGDIENIFHDVWVPFLAKEADDFVFKEKLIIKDEFYFSSDSVEKNVIKINRENYRGGIFRIQRAIDLIDELNDVIAAELN